MDQLNYHHLRYFWAVAREGHLTRAAARLRVSQSALSTQIRQLEEQLGQTLFTRQGRTLELTEAGRVALGYADGIFASGQEMMALLREGRRRERQVLRVGAVATLSRNFQENFVRPLLGRADVELVLQSASLADLLSRLRIHDVDVVLSNRRVHGDTENPWRCRRIARQPVSLVGHHRPGPRRPFRFPDDLAEVPLLLPSREHEIRAGFDLLCERHRLAPRVLAEVDDMALLRLLARDSEALALLPTVVVQDELGSGRLSQVWVVPDLHEDFHAITVQRRYEPPLLRGLLERSEDEVLSPPIDAAPRAGAGGRRTSRARR